VSLGSGAITGFEALIRWPSFRDGQPYLVPPAEFLPVAEETGLIVPIGRWVVEEACRQAASWRREGQPAGLLPVSINVSNKEFWDAGLLQHLDATVAAAGVEPKALVLEITEGVIMHNAAKAEALLEDMHERGLTVHIDDFGTGYSSLEALHRFRLDALKIDRSFVVAMSRGTRSAELVRTIIRMGESLGLDVIAEGIEERDQVRMLQRFGCAYGQGYLFSRPVPAAQVNGLFTAADRVLRLSAG
jgi:EAL domain-containing protein (putative c-di-GMP-specific phosphodiesterase class I)